MAFKLHTEARDWFKKISGSEPLNTLFDLYHICLTLGLASKRFESEGDSMDEFMDDFTIRYRPFQSLMIGGMIAAVLARKGISVSDRCSVAQEIGRMVSGDTTRGDLTADGFRELNGYALGGFNYLRENFDAPPQHAVWFLSRYSQLLSETGAPPKI